eukprot:2973799-Prymnesium_polylepis.1
MPRCARAAAATSPPVTRLSSPRNKNRHESKTGRATSEVSRPRGVKPVTYGFFGHQPSLPRSAPPPLPLPVMRLAAARP